MRAFCLEIELVQHDQRGNILAVGGNQAAVEQFFVVTRHHRKHDYDLRDICRDEFLAILVRSVKQGGPRIHDFDDAFTGPGARHFDAVAAGKRAALAAAYAIDDLGTVELDQVAPAVAADDQATMKSGFDGVTQRSNNASTFAAQMKSFSLIPLIACVM